MWAAKLSGGVWHFDGQDWTNYPLASLDEPVTDAGAPVAAGNNGTVWAATNSGVAHFDGDEWVTYRNEYARLSGSIPSRWPWPRMAPCG